jgi:hypothetical protein
MHGDVRPWGCCERRRGRRRPHVREFRSSVRQTGRVPHAEAGRSRHSTTRATSHRGVDPSRAVGGPGLPVHRQRRGRCSGPLRGDRRCERRRLYPSTRRRRRLSRGSREGAIPDVDDTQYCDVVLTVESPQRLRAMCASYVRRRHPVGAAMRLRARLSSRAGWASNDRSPYTWSVRS